MVVDAASFAIAAALVATSRPAPPVRAAAGPTGGLAREWLDGLAVVRRSPPLRALVLVTALGQLAQGIFVVLVVVFVVRELGGTGTEIGLLRGVQAVGAIAGGVVIGALGHRFDAARLTAPALVLFGVVSFVTWNAPAVTTALAVYVVLFVVVGIPAVAATSGLTTLVQVNTEPAYLGRVLSTLEAGSGAFQVAGLLVAGTLADELGVVAVLNLEAAVWTAAGVVAFVAPHERRRRPGAAAVPGHGSPRPPAEHGAARGGAMTPPGTAGVAIDHNCCPWPTRRPSGRPSTPPRRGCGRWRQTSSATPSGPGT